MNNSWKWMILASLGSFVIGQSAMASDISVKEQQNNDDKIIIQKLMNSPSIFETSKIRETQALGRELLFVTQDMPTQMKQEIGALALAEVQSDIKEKVSNDQKENKILSSQVNKDDSAEVQQSSEKLMSDAQIYEALKLRYYIRKQMLSAWETEKNSILNEMISMNREKSISNTEEHRLQRFYNKAYKDKEKVFLQYQIHFDPSVLPPYTEASERSLTTFKEEAISHALHQTGFYADKAPENVLELSKRYAEVSKLAMDDQIQVTLLEKRLKRVEKNYDASKKQYKKVYEKGSNEISEEKYTQNVAQRDKLRQCLQQKLDSYYKKDWSDWAQKRAHYAVELDAIGYFDREATREQLMVPVWDLPMPVKRFRVFGEARLDYGANHGEEAVGDRARARLRLYGDLNIDDNWHFISMIENEKVLSGSGDDNWMDISRYYLTGRVGHNRLDVGAFGSHLAEGNIYDSKFTGVRITGNEPYSYMAEAGRIDQSDLVIAVEANKLQDESIWGIGGYYFDMNDRPKRSIYMLKYNKAFERFNMGIMTLWGRDTNQSKLGYILTLSKGEERTWVKGNRYYFLKYYYQPYTTYVSHTMTGMADFMHGFKGIGAGMQYTLAENWLLQGEYYRLQDIENGARNHTIWAALSYYFGAE